MKSKTLLAIIMIVIASDFSYGWARADRRWTCIFQPAGIGYRKWVKTVIYAKHPTGGWGAYDGAENQCCCASLGCDSRYFGNPSGILAWAHSFVANSSASDRGEAWTWTNKPSEAFISNTGPDYAYSFINSESAWDGNHLKMKLTGKMGMANSLTNHNLKYRIVIWTPQDQNDHQIDPLEILWDSDMSIKNSLISVTGDLTGVTNFGYTSGYFNDSTTAVPDTVWMDFGEFDSTQITLSVIAEVLPDNFVDDEYNWDNEQELALASSRLRSTTVDQIKLYPNPMVSNCFSIISQTPLDSHSVVIYDILGKEIYRQKIATVTKEITIPLDKPKEGIYLITILNKDGVLILFEKVLYK